MQFEQRLERDIKVTSGDAYLTYRHDRELPKPCVHPIVTPAGATITGFEMSDHVWHRGLWFTIKFVNGSNFWEEHAPFGVQVSRAEPTCSLLPDGALRMTHELDWNSEATGLVFRESRRVTFRLPGDIQIIDWETDLLAVKDLVLDRTPYTTWGGYGGLTFRASRELHDSTYEIPNGESVPALLGDRHEWILLKSSVDGGLARKVSIGMIDHPGNVRGPTPWYGKCSNGYTFFNAALLFHEPMKLGEGKSLSLKYRVIYRDGLWGAGEFAALAKAYREGGK